jgi:uncharacterized protein YraI
VIKKYAPFILVLALFITACAGGTDAPPPSTFITATLPATNPAPPAWTEVPASLVPATDAPPVTLQEPVAEGVTTTQLNLRSEPSTAGETLGTVAAFSTVQIIGKESNGAWYQILDQAGRGWIIASYVQVANSAALPVIDLGKSGLVILGVNVRNGPGRDYASLGTLVVNDVVTLTGKDTNGEWLQINFKGSPGWVAAEFIQTTNAESLPVIAIQNEELPPTAVNNAPPAGMADQDTLEAPIASVRLHPAGAGGLQSSGSLSAADSTDWIQFTTTGAKILIRLDCSSSEVHTDLYESGSVRTTGLLKCNETRTLSIEPDLPYTLKLGTNAETSELIQYSVLIKIVQ